MSTLIELSKEVRALDDLLAMVTDAESPEVQAMITSLLDLTERRAEKVDAYVALIRNFRLLSAGRKEEGERLIAHAKRDEANAAWLEKALHWALNQHDIGKLETKRYTVARVGKGGVRKLLIDDTVPIPAEYMKTEVVTTPDNEKIRAALDAGKELPFAKLAEKGERLSIK